MKRIALVIPSFPQVSETFIVNKFRGLLEKGLDVIVVCNNVNKKEWKSIFKLQEPITTRIYVNLPQRPIWVAVLFYPLALLRCLLKAPLRTTRYIFFGWKKFGFVVLKQLYLDLNFVILNPDIIHFEFGALACGKLYLKELLGCKIVVSFRGYDLNFVGLDKVDYYKEVWEKADMLHFLGNDLWEKALRRGCPPDKPHKLIPPAVDMEYFKPIMSKRDCILGTQEDPIHILSVGRLDWRKGYEYAIEAVSMLVKEGLHLEYRIIGDGAYLEPIAFARYQLGVEKEVKFLGQVHPNKVKEQMEWADIFLHAAVSEGFSNAVLEAQAMGLAVVCSDAGGLPENVINEKTGFIVERRNPKLLAEKVKTLAENAALRKQIGYMARERVLKDFRLEQQTKKFLELYVL